MPEGRWVALIAPALEAIRVWNEDQKARDAIVDIFKRGFLEKEQQRMPPVPWLKIRPEIIDQNIEIAQLCFRVLPTRRVSRISNEQYYYDITVTRTDLPGDDPKRLRKFRYMTGESAKNFALSAYLMPAISWPPYILLVASSTPYGRESMFCHV